MFLGVRASPRATQPAKRIPGFEVFCVFYLNPGHQNIGFKLDVYMTPQKYRRTAG
jgi:hypothetical protein